MVEPKREYQPVDLLEFKRRLQSRVETPQTYGQDPLEELARIIGGEGRIVTPDDDFGATASIDSRTGVATQTARPYETEPGPLHSPLQPSPHSFADEPAFDDPADAGENAHAIWPNFDETEPYENQYSHAAPSDDAYRRLHKHKRGNNSLYMTAAIVLVAGVLGIAYILLGGAASVPVGDADAAAGAELSHTSLQKPGDVTAAAAPAAAPAAAAPPAAAPQSDEGLFPRPRQVRTIPIYGDGTLAGSANATPTGIQAVPAGDASPSQFAEAQPLQMPGAPKASASAAAAPTSHGGEAVADVEQPQAPARRAAKPAAPPTAAEAAYSAILASPAAETEARAMLAELSKKYGTALAGHRLTYHRAKGAEGIIYQVRVAGLASGDAQALCTKLGKAGASCQVGSP